MTQHFHSIFIRPDSRRARAKFLSRMFGIFSEEIVSIWAKDERSPFDNLGRPTIRTMEDSRRHTLDFALKDRFSGNVYVAEMKCEIEFENFKYFVLERVDQIVHHKKPAFTAFLDAAKHSPNQTVYVERKPINIQGAILIWGSISTQGKKAAIDSYGFQDVISVADICRDLLSWENEDYTRLVNERQKWCNELFSGLLGGKC